MGPAQVLDWNDLRFFLAVARHRSLSAAARNLDVAQSTVGRRLAALEADLGVRLLDRTPDGYVPTPAGREARRQAERLEAEALSLERNVAGHDSRLDGMVRIACAETLATHILAPCFASLPARHPGITIELVPEPRELSLSMREADISVRLRRPRQHELFVRRIGRLEFGLYASADYLGRFGQPDLADGCPGQRLIAQTGDLQDAARSRWLTDLASRAAVGLRTASHEAAVSAALHGGGLACLARFRADREEGLRRLPVPLPAPQAEIWLAVHKDNRQAARIRFALTSITGCIRALSARLGPGDP
jgi:DNA-binding transcriptional LysR family regulator